MRSEYVSFSDLYTLDFEITDICAMRQKWSRGSVFNMDHPRKSSAIICLNGCSGVYYSRSGERIEAPCKSLVCLPAFSEYSVLNVDSGLAYPDAYLVEFNVVKDGKILMLGDSPFVIGEINSFMAADICLDIVKNYEGTLRSPVALKASIYNLLAFLGREQNLSRGKKFDSIRVGIELLESDVMYERSIDEIAAICNVSDVCFRRLFKEYSGMTPIEYRTRTKLDRAKSMLLGSDMSIERIAENVGFENGSYFCRVFKKKLGITPTEYRKNNM